MPSCLDLSTVRVIAAWLHPGVVLFVLHVFAFVWLLFAKVVYVRGFFAFQCMACEGLGEPYGTTMSLPSSHRPFTCAGNVFSDLHAIYELPSTSLVTLNHPVLNLGSDKLCIFLFRCSQYQPLYITTTHANDSLTRFKPSAGDRPTSSIFYLGA